MTDDIEIRHCKTEGDALLKENELIREHRPEFNRAKKSPETYYFITFSHEKGAYRFRLAMHKSEKEAELNCNYGAFKGHRTIRKGTGALLRQLYLLEYKVQTPFDFPTVLTGKLTPLQYKLNIKNGISRDNEMQKALVQFLGGKSLDFIRQLVAHLKERGLFGEYIGRLILKDCESLKRFYDQCLHRNYELKQKLNRTPHSAAQA